MGYTITGKTALLRYKYHEAARLGPWELHGGERLLLSATVAEANEDRVAQRPITFVVERPSGDWTWPVETLQMADGRLTATLGPQE